MRLIMPSARGYALQIAPLTLLLALAGSAAIAGTPGIAPGRKYSTIERMTLPRLEALHADVEALKATRKPVALETGLKDYRSILHAHAEDSSHTGGTRPEMLEDAKKVGVNCIMLTNHYRPPLDFITDTWRGMHDGVLFIPGSEARNGFLIYPEKSAMELMEKDKTEGAAFIAGITEGDGLIFLSHIEARVNHSMDGLTGMEIYNNHADAMDDAAMMMTFILRMTDPVKSKEMAEALDRYPAEMFAALVDYQTIYMSKWDRELQKQRVVGVAANDCHHNQVYLVKVLDADTLIVGTNVDKDEDMRKITSEKSAGVKKMVEGHQPGDVLVRLDMDPYFRSFLNCSTHILAPELTEPAIRGALKAGHAYVSHDWLCDPTGFAFVAMQGGERKAVMGDEIKFAPGLTLSVEAPADAQIKLIKNGEEKGSQTGRKAEFTPDGPGVYRIEAWQPVGGEERAWIYANPIYVRE